MKFNKKVVFFYRWEKYSSDDLIRDIDNAIDQHRHLQNTTAEYLEMESGIKIVLYFE